MAPERIVIIGGGPAGLSTARAYREEGGSGRIILIGQESLPPYRRPPLTKQFLRGECSVEELPLESARWYREQEIHLRLGCRAYAVDRAAGLVRTDCGDLEADAVVLATGSEPVRADVPGADHPAARTLRTLGDSLRIAEDCPPGQPVLVLGTGFIGCEIAASLAMTGAVVTLIGHESLPQEKRLGMDAAGRIAGWLEDLGVELVMPATVAEVHGGRAVELSDGSMLEGDLLVLATGVRPRGELAERAGLEMNEGAIRVDAHMQAVEDGLPMLAVGDVAFAHNAAAARHLRVEHWGDALEHGEIAGRVLAGAEARWESVPGFWSTIGEHTLKYSAWGDGYEEARLIEHPDGGFTVWYLQTDGATVGVLTHDHDEDYERGRELIVKEGALG